MFEKLRNIFTIKRFHFTHFIIIISSIITVCSVAAIQHLIVLEYDFSEIKISMFIIPVFVGLTFGLMLSLILISRQTEKDFALAMVKQEEGEKYRLLIENSNDAIYLLYNRRLEIINTKFTELFGITNEQTNDVDFDYLTLVAPDSRSFVEDRIRRLAEGKNLDPKYEFNGLNAAGEMIIVEASTTPVKYKQGVATQGIIRDITEKRLLEQKLQQAQKMEAIGTLAGGVAHDFNNLLTIINGYSEIALLNLDKKKNNYLHKTIENVLNAGKRAENLTRQLLAFSRKQIYNAEIIDINAVIQDMDKILRRLIGEDISMRSYLAKNIPKIKADKSQLEQIFMNLVVNAQSAVYAVRRPGHKKIITIESGFAIMKNKNKLKFPKSSKEGFAFFSVSDNGIGMDDKTKQKIFEPFFTTKDKLKGTGLGLSTIYGIVKQNKGSIEVYSEPGEGAMFKIYWPITLEKRVVKSTKNKAVYNLEGTESILLVEDDENISEYATELLTSLGYNVFRAGNGRIALDAVKTNKYNFDLAITDLIMPELNGKEFVEAAVKILPNIKVIYVSGYTDNHIVHNGLLKKDINFVQKPYSGKTLATKVRQVLDNR